ncbi:RNA polymerase sigma factor [Wenzhouxiangella sp. EGI_FJ10409]|uniref:RNA polymerase sigma factor n=1 Tax=Wenzhouxiangella sp. EGI_FJ10409 TaxID=3243767 RepID=UPI0035E1CB92
MSPDLERDLVRRARAGSLEAFDQLMRAYQDRLYRFVLVRGASRADAEDIVQDSFLAAWQHLGGYRERWRFSTWLYTIARRQASRRTRGHGELPALPGNPTPGPEEVTHSGQQRASIWALARELLPSEWFDVLWLFYAEDRTTKEVARIVGRSVAWVKVTLHRARRRLAESIDAADWLSEEVVSNE